MQNRTTVVRGLVCDVEICETSQVDTDGEVLFYLASIYVAHRERGIRHLVRRSRIPGTGEEIANDVQSRGIRALANLVF